jgi:glycosyltransferase involved in cell wall biosynthesis
MKMSVVICTYNRAELLLGALRTLCAQDFDAADYEIVVVDDGSTDGTAQRVRDASLSPVRVISIPHGGRSAARNAGIAEARGEYVLFVDDDIMAPRQLLRQHYDWHVAHRQTVVRGPIINVEHYHMPTDRLPRWSDRSNAFFCTCNASVSKQGLLAAGGFDETFKEYGFEDNEMGWRLRQRGWKMRFNMAAPVYHYKPARPKSHLDDMIRQAQELGRSAVTYFRKHPHWKVALATGLHPALRLYNRLLASEWLYALCRWLYRHVSDAPGGLRNFLERRILSYHYLQTIELEFQRPVQHSGVGRGEANGELGAARVRSPR